MCLKAFIDALKKQVEPVLLKDFESEEELRAWFNTHTLVLPEPNKCDDYAREARAMAEADGYYMSLCLVNDGIVYQTQVMDKGIYHIADMAIVLHGKSGHQECWFMDLNWRKLVKLCDFYDGGKY
jgi:hypothetical protein